MLCYVMLLRMQLNAHCCCGFVGTSTMVYQYRYILVSIQLTVQYRSIFGQVPR